MLNGVLDALVAMWPWEALAVLFSIVYLLLAIRQNIACWPAAILGAGIYVVLMAQSGLYMQSALQVFYIAMAMFGWWNWRRGRDGEALPVVSWRGRDHLVPLLVIFAGGGLTGLALSHWSAATWPYLDALIAWAAVITTWMVARKVLQNWHYWFVIDAVSAWLFACQGLWLTAILFLVYLVLVVVGYRDWKSSLEATAAASSGHA